MPYKVLRMEEEFTTPLCIPHIAGNEWAYVRECLDTGWVSSVGSFVDRFEQEFASYLGSKYAVATVNGTSALHTALILAGVEPDDEVLVSTLTFIAPVNAIRYVGAWPVFVDAEPRHWQMDTARLGEFLRHSCHWRDGRLLDSQTGRRVRAIVPVHILGHPCDMDSIMELARRYELTVVEDATESLGARYGHRMVGNIGDIACFSFNGNKIITTGGGGMIVSNDERFARRAKYLTTQAKDDPVEFIHGEVGYNYRLTNLQAAMGLAQLENLNSYVDSKRRIAEIYDAAFHDMPMISIQIEAPNVFSTHWMYSISVNSSVRSVDSRALLRSLREAKIETRPLWQPIHLSPAHRGDHLESHPVAEELYRKVLCLPCSVGLSPGEQDRVVEAIGATLKA